MSIRSALEKHYNRSSYGVDRGHVWTTRDGVRIRLGMMEDSHLLNCWRMLDRRLVEASECRMFFFDPFWGPRGEMAQDAALEAMDSMDNRAVKASVWIPRFEEEIRLRGLEVPSRGVPTHPPSVTIVGTGPGGVGTIAKLDRR